MATIRLNLRTDYKSNKGHQVQAILYTGESRPTKIGLKVSVFPEQWNNDSEQVIFVKNRMYSKNEVKSLNGKIAREVDKINLILNNIELSGGLLSGKTVKLKYFEQINKRRKKVDEEQQLDIFLSSLYDNFQKKKKPRSPHRTTFKSFQDYEKLRGKKRLADIGYDLLKDYALWLEDQGKQDTTIDLNIRMLKSFINDNIKHTYKSVDLSYEKYQYQILEKTIIRLTMEEFHSLGDAWNKYKLSTNQQLKLDWFILITSIGGLRISSVEKLTHDNFNKKESTVTFSEVKKKGGVKPVKNPINIYGQLVLEKYNWKMPKLPSRQKYNDGLKAIGKKIQLDRIIEQDIKKGGQIITTKSPLFEFFTSKLSRKTFSSICRDLGVDREIADAMSNHSNKRGDASEAYRDTEDIKLLDRKFEEMRKWDAMFRKQIDLKLRKKTKPLDTQTLLEILRKHKLKKSDDDHLK